MAKHLYLVKDNDELVSHCKCSNALVTFPPQMDCPWCGCGWLFTCVDCRKAFTFARAVLVQESWEELGRRDLTNRWQKKPSRDDVRQWVQAMEELHANVIEGKQYVAFDGSFIASDAGDIRMEGWHAWHELDYVPQVAALDDPDIVNQVLSNREYWTSHRIERTDE